MSHHLFRDVIFDVLLLKLEGEMKFYDDVDGAASSILGQWDCCRDSHKTERCTTLNRMAFHLLVGIKYVSIKGPKKEICVLSTL